MFEETTMSVTLKDLAKTCGVSVGTVSRALNEKNEVSAKTSERIRKLAQEIEQAELYPLKKISTL